MDSHMMDRLREEIELCFMIAKMDADRGENLKETLDYKTAAILISAYNKIAKIYYKEEFIKENSYKSVDLEYRAYCEKESENEHER